MYKALLLNTKQEIVDYRICDEYETAVKQCTEWQLQHEYDFWKTKIVRPGEKNTFTYSNKMKRTHDHKIIWKGKEL